MKKIGYSEEDSSLVDKGPFKGGRVKATDFGESASKYGWDGSMEELRAPFADQSSAGSSGSSSASSSGSSYAGSSSASGTGYNPATKKRLGLVGTLILVIAILAVLFALIPFFKFLYHDVFDDDVPIISDLIDSRDGGGSGSGSSGNSGGWSGQDGGSRYLHSEEDGPEYTLLTTEAQNAIQDMIAGINRNDLADDLEYELYQTIRPTTFEDLGLDVNEVVDWVLSDIGFEENDYSWVEIEGDRAEVDVTVTLHMLRDVYNQYYDEYDYDDTIEQRRQILSSAFWDAMSDGERSECYLYVQFVRDGDTWIIDPYSIRVAYERMFYLD